MNVGVSDAGNGPEHAVNELDCCQQAADFNHEHDGVLHHGAWIQLEEGIDNRASDDAPVPDTQVFALLNHAFMRSEEHTSELQSQSNLVCRLLLEKNNIVLLVVADDEPLRHSLDPCRIAAQWLHLIGHQRHSVACRIRTSIWSNRITLSYCLLNAR